MAEKGNSKKSREHRISGGTRKSSRKVKLTALQKAQVTGYRFAGVPAIGSSRFSSDGRQNGRSGRQNGL